IAYASSSPFAAARRSGSSQRSMWSWLRQLTSWKGSAAQSIREGSVHSGWGRIVSRPERRCRTAASGTDVPNAWRAATEKSSAIARIGLSSVGWFPQDLAGSAHRSVRPMHPQKGRARGYCSVNTIVRRPRARHHGSGRWRQVTDSRRVGMQGNRQRGTRRGWWIGGAAVLLITVLVIALLAARDGFLAGQPDPTGSRDAPSETTQSTAATTPPAPTTPFSVVDEVPLTLPQELRAAHGSFFLRGGTSYLATFIVSTLKPPDQPGLGMYLGVTFSCASADGAVSEWIGGTENLLRGEPVTYRNQILLAPERDQVVTCSVRANAPYDDVAAAGATVELDIHWRVSETSGEATSVPSEARLPMTVDDGARAFAFTEQIAVRDRGPRTVSMLSSLHLTTCTVVNGSREDGQSWCAEG